MASNWQRLLFETAELGVSSALAPELLPNNQVPWAMNVTVRGGKPATRPNLASRLILPPGLIQGGEYFGVQGGMLVLSIAGRMWRIRINGTSFSYENIPLGFDNSGVIKQVWMTPTVDTLVIQDGQSNAILYNGSAANRAIGNQVPRGRQMAYGNGRLWVAVNANEVLAGDIRTSAAGSELLFTEATYLQGGGKLFFGSPITGMAFIPVTGQSDYGALLVFGARESNAIRADITARDDWGKIPGFVTALLRSVGSAGQWPVVSINQDLYWRDSNGGIRSIRNALADEAGPGSAPISREVSRLTDYDSQQLLPFCSGVYFDNRLLMTSSPYLMSNGGIGWKDIIPLDFAPLSSMGGKSQPAYDGKWNGINFVKLVAGEFRGKNRAFALTTDESGINELWEFGTGERADLIIDCTDGTALMENPITSFVEYPRRNFGEAKRRKRLNRCDVYLSSVNGDVDLKVYWRADNWQKWLLWDEASTCAKTTDAATAEPHVWKNLLTQDRPQFKTFTIPDTIDEVAKYSAQVGFEFQIRLVWTGSCRIHRMMLMAELLEDPDYADRTGFEMACIENDVSGNDVQYHLRTNCDDCVLTFTAQPETDYVIDEGGTGTIHAAVATEAEDVGYQWQFSTNDGASWNDLHDTRRIHGTETDTLTIEDIDGSGDDTLYRLNVYLPGCAPGDHDALNFYSDSARIVLAQFVGCDLIQGSTRGGVFQLCGFPEYINPSTPPRLFRTQTLSGQHLSCQHADIPCTSPLVSPILTRMPEGSYSYDPMTCAESNTQRLKAYLYVDSAIPCAKAGPLFGDSALPKDISCVPLDICNTLVIPSPTQIVYDGNIGYCSVGISEAGEVYQTLSDEDTDGQAIIRLLDGEAWSAYGTCPVDGCPQAEWQARTGTATSGVFIESRFRVVATVPQGQTRFIRVGFFRSVHGADNFSLAAVANYPLLGNGDNEGILEDEIVQNPQGFDTFVLCLPPE